MNNFPFKYYGKEYWYSRSVVCTNYVFAMVHNNWYVLAAQRGINQTQPNKWNVPGGFLDHDETCEECAIRETYEETGVTYFKDTHLFNINSWPGQFDKQHVVMSHYVNLGEFTSIYKLPKFDTSHNEPGETQWIRWIPVSDIDSYIWIDNQKKMILKIYHNKINPNFIQRIKNFILKYVETKIN